MPKVKMPSGNLYIGLSTDGKHVIVNHPDLQPDAEGCGHIVFSHDEALNLAALLIRKVNTAKGIVCGHCGDALTESTGWATAQFAYCFKPDCQQEFYAEAQAMIRGVAPEMADRLAVATKVLSERQTPSFILCPTCGTVSYNPNDITNRYCGRCHIFLGDKA